MALTGPTQIFFVPSIQVATFDMPEYRERLEKYVQLPNVAGNIFVGKFTLKSNSALHYKPTDYVGGAFVIETIHGDVNDMIQKYTKSLRKTRKKKSKKSLKQKKRSK